MDKNIENLFEEVKKLFLRYEEHDRPLMYADKNKVCKFRTGWASKFSLSWNDTPFGGTDLYCYLDYPGFHIRNLHISEKEVPLKTKFLTKKSFEEELVPALQSWMNERVQADEYGGMFGGNFLMSLTFNLRNADGPREEIRWYQAFPRVQNEGKLLKEKEIVKDFIKNKEYIDAEIDGPEYYSCVERICLLGCGFLEELGIDTLKDFLENMIINSKKARLIAQQQI